MNEKNFEYSARILIAASGTGGHLVPAAVVANEIKRLCPKAEITFVGSGRPLEKEILEPTGFPVKVVSLGGLKGRGLSGLYNFIKSFPAAFSQTLKIFSETKPDLVLGMGGYTSFLPILLARLRGIPSWIHEAEIKPGTANRYLSALALVSSCSFLETTFPFNKNPQFTGHPLRPEVATIAQKPIIAETPLNLFVTGGSQGAETIDRAMIEIIPFLKEQRANIVHQCRKNNVELLRNAYELAGIQAEVKSYISDPWVVYDWCHLIVARSGAGTTLEISVINKPTIFIPYPSAQGNHQEHNAQTLAAVGKAIIVRENPHDFSKFSQDLKSALKTLFEPSQYSQIRARQYAGRKLDGATAIAKGVLSLARQGAKN